MVPPFRNFTTKMYCRMIKYLRPDLELSKQQKDRLLEALEGVIDLILAHINSKNISVGLKISEKIT
jgi:hypothetical protein